MKLVIAEKPSVAQTIAKVIGAYKRGKGYLLLSAGQENRGLYHRKIRLMQKLSARQT